MNTTAAKNKSVQETIYDSTLIQKRINQAAKVKQQLEADIFKRDERIKKAQKQKEIFRN